VIKFKKSKLEPRGNSFMRFSFRVFIVAIYIPNYYIVAKIFRYYFIQIILDLIFPLLP